MAQRHDNEPPRRKRRTREHVIEDLSENYLERQVLLCGHVLRRPVRDYAVDVTMFHFSDDGQLENGEVRFQLKATECLNVIRGGEAISFPLKTGDLHYWGMEVFPFVLVVFDASEEVAYFLDVQDYVSQHPDVVGAERVTVNVHIPRSNRLTVRSIQRFRTKSLATVKRLRNQGGLPDVPRKPH